MSYQNLEAGVERPQLSTQSNADAESFFKYTFPAVRDYRLDMAALQAVPTRVVLAGGSSGQEYMGYRGAVAVAERLERSVVEFPGHHAGYVSHPQAFARRLHEVLANEASMSF